MQDCPRCGTANPDQAKFCMACANPLAAALAPTEERKLVTVLFCDLVGFTARSDRADPEDVKATLRPFHTRLKRAIEAFGGTLDKFIGDAALGVFGSPLAHEDDAERAVRAALAIQAAIVDLNETAPGMQLAIRIGINTGEAVVSYGTGPQIGESVTGDVVNTASRLQSVAPVGGIVVGESTFRATQQIFEYEALAPVSVKGKAEPLPIWQALTARARFGADLAATYTTPMVGRQIDLGILESAFENALQESSVRLVTIVGEPGVGKSRLVAELGSYADGRPETIVWRQGRCLPYGEGITFWALGEIMKAHAGIYESDSPDAAAAKLDATLPADAPDREWLRQRLLPLVGLESSLAADRNESFTAWRRFLESIAEGTPAVFVFEDIHWADDAMLSFLEHVADGSENVPILLVTTARPELYDRRGNWGGRRRNVTTVSLAPLSPQETARLISALLDQAVLASAVQSLVLEHAGGNPLYAEEFVRMLKERNLLVRSDQSWELVEGAEIPLPAGVQGIIAARLDTLASATKALLQNASVIGKEFWAGAVASMAGRDDASVHDALHELSRRELVRRTGSSSIQGETEYAFWHGLVRDVCYSQIPRGSRATMHRAAAQWIERVAADRLEDLAEVLAHHYTTALQLAGAAGQTAEAADLESPTLRFLVMAGDRALGLDVARAETHYARALDLARPGKAEHPEVLAKWADAVRQAGRSREAAGALDEAIDGFLERGDRLAAGRAMGTLSSVLHTMGSARQEEVARKAVELLESQPPGPDLVAAYARMAGVKLVQGDMPETIYWVDRAVALASSLGLDVPARALGFRGYARCTLGDAAGLRDMRAALALATERGEGRDAAVLYNNLAVAVWPIEGPTGVLAMLREGIEFSDRRGIEEFALALSAASLDQLVDTGKWDSAIELAQSLDHQAETSGDVADLLQARWSRTRILALRGEAEGAASLAEWLVGAARESGGVEDMVAGLTASARAYLAAGRAGRSVELLSEIAETPHVAQSPMYPPFLCEMVRTAWAAGDSALAARLASRLEPVFPYHQHALHAAQAILAEARGDRAGAASLYADAAERWDRFGVVPERAFALLGQGRCLVALANPEAPAVLREAREIFVALGAKPAVAEIDFLLQGATASGSDAATLRPPSSI